MFDWQIVPGKKDPKEEVLYRIGDEYYPFTLSTLMIEDYMIKFTKIESKSWWEFWK